MYCLNSKYPIKLVELFKLQNHTEDMIKISSNSVVSYKNFAVQLFKNKNDLREYFQALYLKNVLAHTSWVQLSENLDIKQFQIFC